MVLPTFRNFHRHKYAIYFADTQNSADYNPLKCDSGTHARKGLTSDGRKVSRGNIDRSLLTSFTATVVTETVMSVVAVTLLNY